MASYDLGAAYTGPYTVPANSVIQNDGGGSIFIDFSGSSPSDDDDALELPQDMNVIRVSAERTIYARAKDGSARLKVTDPI